MPLVPALVALCAALLGEQTSSATRPPERALAVAREIIAGARFATLATVAGSEPRARIVDPAPPDADFTIWVATNPRTRKVAELKRSPRIALLYFNAGGGEYVNVEGTATLVTRLDEIAAHWHDAWTPFYPGGVRGPNVVLIRVVPSRLEIVSPARDFDTDPATWRPFVVDLRR